MSHFWGSLHGASNDYGYNSRSQLTSVVIRDATNAVIASYGYALDSNGTRTGIAYHDGSAAYNYDALNRLTGETVSSASLGNYSKTFSYDDAGNRLDPGASFGADNRLLADQGGTYGFDNNGNVTSYGARTFSYDSTNRLIGFSNGGVSVSYQYDYLGRRTAKTVNGATREFLYDGSDIIAEYMNGVQAARYTYGLGIDEPLMVTRGGQTFFYHADGLGNVVAITNNAGQVVQRYGYDVFGNVRLNAGSFAFSGSGQVNTLTFTGREYDEESGLYHYRARSYGSATGRFLQKDPQQGNLSLPQTQNLYAYALNNPINFTDPSGEAVLLEYVKLVVSGPSAQQQAAALAGFVLGYAIPQLIFAGEILALSGAPLDTQELWDRALLQTLEQLKVIYTALGIAGEVGDCASDILKTPVSGVIGAFLYGNSSFSVGISRKNLDAFLYEYTEQTLDCLGVPTGVSSDKIGGFDNGVRIALKNLKALRPR